MRKIILLWAGAWGISLALFGWCYAEEVPDQKKAQASAAVQTALAAESAQVLPSESGLQTVEDGKETEVLEEDWEALWGPENPQTEPKIKSAPVKEKTPE